MPGATVPRQVGRAQRLVGAAGRPHRPRAPRRRSPPAERRRPAGGRARSPRRCGPPPARRGRRRARGGRRAPRAARAAAPARAPSRPAAAACRRCPTAAGAAVVSPRERGVGGQPPRERRAQPRGLVDVVELDQLHRRVHVAQRHADRRRRDARARRSSTASASVPGRPRRSPRPCTGSPRPRRPRRAARTSAATSFDPRTIAGPEPRWWRPFSFSSIPGASVAWVTSTTIATSGCERVGGRRRRPGRSSPPARPRPRRRRPGASPASARAAQRLVARRSSRGGCPSSATTTRPLGSSIGSAGDHGDVADAHHPARLVAVLGADVDVQVAQLGRPSCAPPRCSRWIGFLPTTPGMIPSRVTTSSRWPTRITGSQPPTPQEPQEAVVVDVGDDQPDLVDVADDRDASARRRGAGRLWRPTSRRGRWSPRRSASHAARNAAAASCS